MKCKNYYKKYLILGIIVILAFFILSSCREKDVEKYKFVERIIRQPDSLESIIKSSPYYSEHTYILRNNGARQHIIQYMKSLNFEEASFNDRYFQSYDSDKKLIYQSLEIKITTPNECYEKKCRLYFLFESLDNKKWFLIYISPTACDEYEM
jgi:hypothetical protein